MPIHNFMVEDIAGSLSAICLFPLFLLIPGYSLGWLLDVFDFRRRGEPFRAALGLLLSIAVCPIVTYWLGRFGSMAAVWGFYAATAAVFIFVRLRRSSRIVLPEGFAVFGWIAVAWLAIVILSLVDLQWGDRLYYPTNSLDYSLRAAFTHSISVTGVPPQSPLFLPAQPVLLRYHYFWLMMCSLVNQLAPRFISARQAEIAGTFWCGLGLMALLAICLRVFLVNPSAPFRRRALVGVLLLGITGLDILPGLFFLFLYARGLMDFVLPSLESWNEYVDWFLHSVLWAPHAVAALIAAFSGFLLLWHAAAIPSRRASLWHGLLGGAALASSVGTSIWVTFVFAAFLTLWTAVCAWKRWRRETEALLLAGFTAALLALPYLLQLRSANAGPPGGGGLLQLTVRAFSLTALVPGWRGMHEWTRLILVNGALLPLNYLLEFGFFFLVGALKWRLYRTSQKPLPRRDLACFVLLATSTLICTFLKSAVIGNNDLGWRGFLPAQFVLLLWSVDIWIDRDRPGFLSPQHKHLLVVFIGLGVAGTAYDLAITRSYPILADRGVVPPIEWMGPDRQFGKRTYAAREAYEWARAATPEQAVIQFNPVVAVQETPSMLYADRRVVAIDKNCNTAFGGDPALCKPIVRQLEALYPKTGQPASATVEDVCANLPIDLLVAKDTDAVWRDGTSWVWTERPAFSNTYMRLFRCGSVSRAAKAVH